MNEFAKVCITIQMQNDFESDEACITTTMIRTYANALQGELRKPGKDLIGKTILDQVTAMARANAALMGYELTSVATASILD